ncbi:hypothetical protein V5O48_014224 [Marasmius crinis-equi]|uniref:Glycoside hydrolase family 79 protein n=1 Tax=Marasmius crinis-equi TaxID=585013 RepID=A0ABR3EYA9_9AGAR
MSPTASPTDAYASRPTGAVPTSDTGGEHGSTGGKVPDLAIRADIPSSAPAGVISFTQPPQFSTSFFKIAENQPITFAWNATYILATPTSLTINAVGTNGFTYPVGPSDGKIPGDATSVVWDAYSYQQAHPQTPLAVGLYQLQVCDERGMGAGLKPGYLSPNQNLKFALYTPGAYTAQASGWDCPVCNENGALASYTVGSPLFMSMFVTFLVMFLSGFSITRRRSSHSNLVLFSTHRQEEKAYKRDGGLNAGSTKMSGTVQLTLCLLASLAQAVTVSLPSNAPAGAFVVSPSLISLSIEQDLWTDWAGLDERNEFFFNTLDNIAQITGEPPQIRIGANSVDNTDFNKDLEVPQFDFLPPTNITPYPEATQIVVGDAFYKTARFLPPNTRVTWGVNFGRNNLTAAFLQAQSIKEAFSLPEITEAGIKLDLVELGNEPNLYPKNGHRPENYTVADYVPDLMIVVRWIEFAKNVSVTVGIDSTSDTKFVVGGFAGATRGQDDFTAPDLFAEGILGSEPGALISRALQACPTLRVSEPITCKSLKLIIPKGAALWALDYALFARTINITRVFFHEGIGYKYNLIQPATLNRSIIDGSDLPAPLPPHVQPQYYAAIIAAEAIGDSGSTHLAEINVDDERIAGYAFFEDGVLVRAVFVNAQAYLSDSTETARPSVHLDLDFGNATTESVTVKRLLIGHADDVAGLTWGGQSYETPDARVNGTLEVETVSVKEGVDISATEAVLLSFDA